VDAAKRAKDYADAPKVRLADYLERHPNGMLVWNDDRFVSAGTLDSYDIEGMPDEVWVCDPVELNVDASEVIERATEELYEDAADDCDRDSLQALLDDWCKAQNVTSWLQSKQALHPEDVKEIRAELGTEDEAVA
jgi:hypothetical protein